MVFKSYRLHIISRILLLTLTIGILIYSYLSTDWIITPILFSIIFVLQFIGLVSFADKVNRDLSRFLTAIVHRDFSQVFASEGKGKSFNELRDSLNLIILEFQKLSAEKQAHYNYLQTIVEHIGTGLISYNTKGEVELYNNAAQQILGVRYVKNIKAFDRIMPELYSSLQQIKSGEKELLKINTNKETLQLSLRATELSIQGQRIKLIAFQNIKSELEEQELEAWQKLISVLTHEIMNSVTPITSLTSTTLEIIKNQQSGEAIEMNDIEEALQAIERRSKGLLHFVDVYKNLTRSSKPKLQEVYLEPLIHDILRLFKNQLIQKNIRLIVNIPDTFKLTIDSDLIEQVIINLVLNAIDAVKEKQEGIITIQSGVSNNARLTLEISDNGNGISTDNLDKIFIPFFTTKEKGSGIGLSLCRQIMRLHNGTIAVQSIEDTCTTFTLSF